MCEFPGCTKAFSNASDRAKHQNRTHSNEVRNQSEETPDRLFGRPTAVRINTFPPTIRKSRFPPQSCWAEPWGGIYYFFTSTVPWLYRTPKWARALIGGRQRHLTPLETKIKPPCEGRLGRYPALCASNESFY